MVLFLPCHVWLCQVVLFGTFNGSIYSVILTFISVLFTFRFLMEASRF